MNIDWIDFLKSNNAEISDNLEIQFPKNSQQTNHSITALLHLSIIKVTGKDASQFLQGQLTCNINELTNSNSFFAAFCNAKGQVISSLLILKNVDDFFIVLPKELIDKVSNKLKMYILRSDVQMHDVSDDFCLMGLQTDKLDLIKSLPKDEFSIIDNTEISIKFPINNRYLIISPVELAPTLWTKLITEQQLSKVNSNNWLYGDISAGIAWLTETSSEQFIPQMLNIDKLGGISFNKGCYTGQEIVARTHYLGKAKRKLSLIECSGELTLNKDSHFLSNDSGQSIGQLLSSQFNGKNTRILAVIPIDNIDLKNLTLNISNQAKITTINFQ